MSNIFDLSNRIVYEDNHLIIINKLPSEIVQDDQSGDVSLITKLKDYIKKRDNKSGNVFIEVIHRIDRPVSGLIMFAKTSKALSRFNEMMRENKIEKFYYAVVAHHPPKTSDTLEHFIVRNQKKNKSKAVHQPLPDGKKAILKYQLIAESERYFLLQIQLITGRHHQIRAQLSAIHCPIKGDIKYGYPRTNKGGYIHLHSFKLTFEHPIKKETVSIQCKPAYKDVLWNDIFDKYLI